MRISLFYFFLLCAILAFAQTHNEGRLKVGDKAPDFNGQDISGRFLTLDRLCKKGPVVIMFYRGSWCPYCKTHLTRVQDSLQYLVDKGASVVVITSEAPQYIEKMVEKMKLTFSIIHDADYRIMQDYAVGFKVNEYTVPAKTYKFTYNNMIKYGVDGMQILPVPATYVIGQDKKIKYAHFRRDYKKRATIQSILERLP